MTEPTPEAYEAARAAYDQTVISHGAIGHRAGHHDAILAAVDAVWDLAEATVRAKVAAEIHEQLGKIAVRLEAKGRAGDKVHLATAAGVRLARLRVTEMSDPSWSARIAEGKGDETP